MLQIELGCGEPALLSSHLTRHNIGRATLQFDSTYELQRFGLQALLFRGRAFLGDKRLCLGDYSTAESFATDLSGAVGNFTLVQCEPDRVRVATSLYRDKVIYFAPVEGGYVISTELRGIYDRIPVRTLNTDYCYNFLAEQQAFAEDSIFSEISQAQLGCQTTLQTDCSPIVELFNTLPTQRANVVGLVEENIHRWTDPDKTVFVHMSGGLDSSAVLWAARQRHRNVTAVHLLQPSESLCNEEDIARQTSASFGAPFVLHRVDYDVTIPKQGFSLRRNENCIFDISPILFDRDVRHEAFRQELTDLGMREAQFIGGQGGDSVFHQNPGPSVAFDAYQAGGIWAALRQLSAYCRLKQASLAPAARAAARSIWTKETAGTLGEYPDWLNALVPKRDARRHKLLEVHNPRSAKYQHVSAILLALYSHETYDDGPYQIAYPMLMQNVVGLLMEQPISQLFSAKYDRIVLRSDFFDISGSDSAWRRSKRSASGMMTDFLANNYDLIRDVLASGQLRNRLGLDVEWLQRELEHNAFVGLNDSFFLLFACLHLEIFLTQFDNL